MDRLGLAVIGAWVEGAKVVGLAVERLGATVVGWALTGDEVGVLVGKMTAGASQTQNL